MSEYWKSTPKYWCKFCSAYVRDTPLARRDHDSTARHQSAIQRSLKTIHRAHERDERDKQRAKDEVARLKGEKRGDAPAGRATVSGAGAGGRVGGAVAASAQQPQRKATMEDRMRQMKSLADMGVAIPEEFRREMGMVGEWQTISERAVSDHRPGSVKREDGPVKVEGDDRGEVKNFGVRKRRAEEVDEYEEEQQAAMLYGGGHDPYAPLPKPKPWGSRFKSYPGGQGGSANDFDAFVNGEGQEWVGMEHYDYQQGGHEGYGGYEGQGEDGTWQYGEHNPEEGEERAGVPEGVKHEGGEQKSLQDLAPAIEPASGIVFKKRKKKA